VPDADNQVWDYFSLVYTQLSNSFHTWVGWTSSNVITCVCNSLTSRHNWSRILSSSLIPWDPPALLVPRAVLSRLKLSSIFLTDVKTSLVTTRYLQTLHVRVSILSTVRSCLKSNNRLSEWVTGVHSTHNRSFQRRVFPGNWLHWYWQPETRTQNTAYKHRNLPQQTEPWFIDLDT